MKSYINLFTGICLSFATAFLSGMEGCNTEDEVEPAVFVSATPPDGSTIQEDATIVATFEMSPSGLAVNVPPGATFSSSGTAVTITGRFPAGALNLIITWSGGTVALTYTVEPDIPSPPEGMVLIPEGEFQMGSEDDESQPDEQPIHTVHVDAFYMDAYEVTNLDYQHFVLANPEWQKDRIPKRFNGSYLREWEGNTYPEGGENHPVIHVSWYAAVAYSKWAGKRLPTEAEWEKAARGGLSGKKYPHGNSITPKDANYNYPPSVKDMTAVGDYPANGYGLYDMAGNVWEWCLDEYDADFYATFPPHGVARNPHGVARNPLSGANSIQWLLDNYTNNNPDRVLRGGSWFSRGLRVAYRLNNTPSRSHADFGFRCVRSISL